MRLLIFSPSFSCGPGPSPPAPQSPSKAPRHAPCTCWHGHRSTSSRHSGARVRRYLAAIQPAGRLHVRGCLAPEAIWGDRWFSPQVASHACCTRMFSALVIKGRDAGLVMLIHLSSSKSETPSMIPTLRIASASRHHQYFYSFDIEPRKTAPGRRTQT